MQFSRCLLTFWLVCTILAITSVCLGSWLFASIYFLELSSSRSDRSEYYEFHWNLFWWVLAEIITSVLLFIYWSHLHCRLAQKKIEEKIPMWIFLNTAQLYVTFGCFLFPSFKEYQLYHHPIKNRNVDEAGQSKAMELMKTVAHFYFGLLLVKALSLGGLILSLVEHRRRMKRIDLLLDDLNLGDKRRNSKRDSFIL